MISLRKKKAQYKEYEFDDIKDRFKNSKDWILGDDYTPTKTMRTIGYEELILVIDCLIREIESLKEGE